MIVSYDNLVGAVYIKMTSDSKIAKTVEFAPETLVDLAKDGKLIGIEMLNPGRRVLKRLAKKFHSPELTRINLQKLQEAVS